MKFVCDLNCSKSSNICIQNSCFAMVNEHNFIMFDEFNFIFWSYIGPTCFERSYRYKRSFSKLHKKFY
jgi:hypothetical protein